MKRQIGFTLIEMAVVVFLIGILATLGITALNTQLANAAISATQSRQYILKDALMNYLRVNKRLPCPATDGTTGQENRINTAPAGTFDCKAQFGIVPYNELGLPQSAALDGWNNFFSYAVSPQWTLTYSAAAPAAGGTTGNVGASTFNPGNVGSRTVNNRVPATNATPTSVTTTAVAVIVSHGINGLGAFTSKGTQNAAPAAGTDELANTPDSTTWLFPAAFYQRDYTATNVPTYGAFDDMVVWLSANDLLTPLTKDGALPSAEAQWAVQADQINKALITFMFTTAPTISPFNCAAPLTQGIATAPAANSFYWVLNQNNIPLVDPWGGPLTYTLPISRIRQSAFTGTLSTTPAQTYPYTITPGPSAKFSAPSNITLWGTYQSIIQNCN